MAKWLNVADAADRVGKMYTGLRRPVGRGLRYKEIAWHGRAGSNSGVRFARIESVETN
jgi:hypothetical protein